MSTPQLTLVAGEFRMPRLRPLELVSRSIGREWSLLPPNVSFRTELKALYAAMLRTFCLSADAIRTMCRWDPQSLLQPSPAQGEPAAAIRSGQPGAIPLGMRDPTRSPAPNDRQRNAMAGAACAIGGAAMITWLMVNHPRQPASPPLAAAPEVTLGSAAKQAGGTNQTAHAPGRSDNVDRPADTTLRWNRARGDLAARKPDDKTTGAQDIATARVPPTRIEPTTKTTSRSSTSRAIDAVKSASPKHAKPSVAGHAARDAHKAHPAKREQAAFASTGARRTPHATVRLKDVAPHVTVRPSYEAQPATQLSTERRARQMPSVAGAYSPPAPSAQFGSDYDSITMSAGTHVRELASAVPRRDRVNTDSTEWMNHMSQRRVTEIPDHFSK